MEKRDNQPTAERPLPEEPVQQITPPDDNYNGAMAEPHELSDKEKADRFIGKALSSLEELKTECGEDEEKKRIHDSFGLCLEGYYTLQEIEAHMLATHDVSAEKVRVMYTELVERSGSNARGGEAYEEYAREKDWSVKEKAGKFIGEMLRLFEGLQEGCGEDEEELKTNYGSLRECFSLCYTLQEMVAHMLAAHDTTAENVGNIYNSIVVGTGGEAYEKHSMDCARLREKEANEAGDRRIGNVHGVSVSGVSVKGRRRGRR